MDRRLITCWWETTKHRAWVAWYILKACRALLVRAWRHDMSKYSKEEAPFFAVANSELRKFTYGSDEYIANLSLLKTALRHHYENNSHHPEHWEAGIKQMSPLDLIEMLCDWKAATKRHPDGSIAKSILAINPERYGYGERTTEGFMRAASEIGLLDG